jgi:hypothetical protein
MKKIVIATVLGLLSVTTTAQAYDRTSGIDRREAAQERQIQRGVRSGEITRGEYRRLETEQARIRQMERNAARDGHIDRREAARIRSAQDAAQRHIYQESHDSQRRW